MAMEYCAGGTLQQRLRTGCRRWRPRLLAAARLLATLDVLHSRGIVHGDCKPANLLFREADDAAEPGAERFWFARLAESTEKKGDQAPQGTLAYMAPEQFRGGAVPASDVYACAIILLESLGGAAALT